MARGHPLSRQQIGDGGCPCLRSLPDWKESYCMAGTRELGSRENPDDDLSLWVSSSVS